MTNAATPEQRLLIDACLRVGVPFTWRSRGTLLISGQGIADVLRDVAGRGAQALGLEGFDLDPDVHPRLDLIFDADHSPSDAVSVASAWGEEVWIDVVLELGIGSTETLEPG